LDVIVENDDVVFVEKKNLCSGDLFLPLLRVNRDHTVPQQQRLRDGAPKTATTAR
jgi:hypothetical protein